MKNSLRLLSVPILGCLLATATVQAQDSTPPTVTSVFPSSGATVVELRQVVVDFSEDVTGVDAADLLVNGTPATELFVQTADRYRFVFAQPANGPVQIQWAGGHGITDAATPPNAFAGGALASYTLDPSRAIYGVRINEFVADNDTGIRDEDGTYQDWIELYNAGISAANLNGCYLTDSRARLANWRIPDITLAPNSYLIIWASGKFRTNVAAPLHTNFRLDPGGEYLGLIDPTGTNVISQFSPTYPPQRTDVSYGRDPGDPSFAGYYTRPTPGAINVGTGADFAGDVVASRESGLFFESFNVTLRTTTGSGTIYYVLVTNAATASSAVTNVPSPSFANALVYTAPITVNQTMQIRTRAFETNKLPGAPVTFSYIQVSSNLANFSSDVPILIMDTLGANTLSAGGGGSRDTTSVIVELGADESRASFLNQPKLISRAGVNDRGSSTQGQPKPNVAVEFWNEFNDDLDRPLVGLPPESDWVLYGINGFDPSLMHNAIFHWLGRQIGHYSSRTRYVEVFWNRGGVLDTNDYWGLYLVEEKVKRNKNRADIASLQPENNTLPSISGGYLLRIDRVDSDEITFNAPSRAFTNGAYRGVVGGNGITYVYPDSVVMRTDTRRVPQRTYIQSYFTNFMNALAGPSYTNPIAGYAAYMDPKQWVENHIANTIAFNVDGYRLSGYIFKDRDKRLEQGPNWDCDRCLGTGGTVTPQGDNRPWHPRIFRTYTTDVGSDQGTDFFGRSPVGVNWWDRLFRDPDFWQLWIDTYQTLRTNLYTDAQFVTLVDGFYTEIKEAQGREEGRWARTGFTYPRAGRQSVNTAAGAFSHTTVFDFGLTNRALGNNIGYFTNEVNHQKWWLTNRLDFLDTNFLAMPQLSSGGGRVTNGATVTVTPATKAGTILLYTLDGTDPRLPGGAISPNARTNNGQLTVAVTQNIRIFARSYNPLHANLTNATLVGNPPINSFWSGPVAGTYFIDVPPLRITEIMYHPAAPLPGNTNDADNFEYVELRNTGPTPLNVGGFRFTRGLGLVLDSVTLPPGQSGVVVRDMAAFLSRYPGAGPILGVYTNNLANNGERLTLEGPVGEPILDFSFNDNWYPITDGHGYSLQIRNDLAPVETWGLRESWRPSGVLNGTPGAADPGDPGIPQVVINELLSHTDLPAVDAVELRNLSASDANIGNWYLTDDFGTPKKFRIPAGTTIPGGGTRVFTEADFNPGGGTSFSFSSLGDEAYLFSGAANGDLSGYVHGFDFGAQANGVTFGRYVISTGNDHFVRQVSPTLGAPNSGPAVGPVVISEINYHPVDVPLVRGGFRDNDGDEFIELQNITGSPVPLFDPANPANTWRLRDAVDFDFPAGVTLAPNELVLVVSFIPTNGPTLAAFRTRNNVPPATRVFGPWSGQLDNSSDRVELNRPDLPDPITGFVPYVLVERVSYNDSAPWPAGADGIGPSLQRTVASSYGNDPTNWVAGGLSPGAAYVNTGLPTITRQPESQTNIAYNTVVFSVTAGGPGPTTYQWRFNGTPIFGATGPNLVLSNVRPDQQGEYDVVVLNPAGTVTSDKVRLFLKIPLQFVVQPQSQAFRVGSNVTFSVVVQSPTPPVTYQWLFNGRPIPGATSPTLMINNIDVPNGGDYVCTATDGVSSSNSATARLSVLINPIIVLQPTSQNVAPNGLAGFSVIVTNTATRPIGFRWRRNGVTADFQNLNQFQSVFVTNAMGAGNYDVIVTNAANMTGERSVQVTLTVVTDTDGDGIPDDVEVALGLNPNDAADAALDPDGDRMSNLQESIAGTDPRDSNSVLRVTRILPANVASIEFNAVSNRSYVVQGTPTLGTNLLGQGKTWSTVGYVAARATNFTATVEDRGPGTNRFYRLATPGAP